MSRGGPSFQFVAELVGAGRGAAARPAFVQGEPVALSGKQRGEARVGDLVMVTVKGRQGRVVEVYGPARSPSAVMRALLADNGKGWGLPRKVDAAAAAIADTDPLSDPELRDLTAQAVVTIDPEGAKDHDDAIAAEIDGDDVRLWVHIADVTHYVTPGDPVDVEAERRGCSVYLPSTVDPMLPTRLSNDLCSLRPGVVRRVVTAEMRVARDGSVHSERFYRSAIESECRLTYPDVDRYIDGVPLPAPGLAGTVDAAREAARRMRARRDAKGGLTVGAGEPQFTLAPDGVTDVHIEHQTESHRIVEDCMVAANEAVARHLIAKGVPALFRHHPDPDQARVERLYERLAALDVPTPALPDHEMGPAECRAAATAAGDAVARHVAALEARGDHRAGAGLWTLVLRALAQAFYTPLHVMHSGLASAAYCHFTSPIRRYPDVVVHRALLHSLGADVAVATREELEVVGQEASDRERDAAALERRGDRVCAAMYVARLVRDDPQRVFSGEVTGVLPGGVFVTFGPALEGFLPARRISDETLVLDALEVALVGERSERGLRLGDAVDVRVHDTEPLRGRVSLVWVSDAAPKVVGVARSRRRQVSRRG